MSTYEWENGSLKFSVAEYSKFKKAFLAEVNNLYAKANVTAVQIYEKMIAEAKGKRKVDWFDLFRNCRSVSSRDSWGFVTYRDLDPLNLAYKSMFRKTEKKGEGTWAYNTPLNTRPSKPRKGDFVLKTKQKDPSFSFEDARIQFNDARRIVYWEVNENNHAVDRSREHDIAKIFFSLLNKVKWTRGTGGVLVGNNEYNRDDRSSGGGGNYVTASYGPLGGKQRICGY